MDMNSINQAANTTTQYETAKTSKSKISGRTIGDVKLSDEAAKYYEQLKEKYSNMEFVLVSKDMKEQAQAQAASFANPAKMVVLIDEEKIEKMATDENFRAQYEGVKKIMESSYIERADIFEVDRIRDSLRELIKYLPRTTKKAVYTDFQRIQPQRDH